MANQTPDIVRLYLQEIGRYSLLTPEQEISCARKVQMMVAIKQKQFELAQQLNRQPTDDELATSLAQTEAEVQSIRNQGELAQHNMVTANLRLVVSIAKKYQNSNLELLDLIQEGTLGLHRGIEKFDPNKGYKQFAIRNSQFAINELWGFKSPARQAARFVSGSKSPDALYERLCQRRLANASLTQNVIANWFNNTPRINALALNIDTTYFVSFHN
jgi:hypothetical protein